MTQASYKFRLLQGLHIGPHPTLKRMDGTPVDLTFHPGDIIETHQPLDARLNIDGCRKFERLHDNIPTGHIWDPTKETLEEFSTRMRTKTIETTPAGEPWKGVPIIHPSPQEMSLDEIKALAAEEEIDLMGAKTREEALLALKLQGAARG